MKHQNSTFATLYCFNLLPHIGLAHLNPVYVSVMWVSPTSHPPLYCLISILFIFTRMDAIESTHLSEKAIKNSEYNSCFLKSFGHLMSFLSSLCPDFLRLINSATYTIPVPLSRVIPLAVRCEICHFLDVNIVGLYPNQGMDAYVFTVFVLFCEFRGL